MPRGSAVTLPRNDTKRKVLSVSPKYMYPRRNLIKYLTREQTARFFGVIKNTRDRALFACIYHYGLRVSEATLLQLTDVDFEHRRIVIHRLKHGIGGERPLLANTAELIRAYLPVRLRTGAALFTGRQGGLKHGISHQWCWRWGRGLCWTKEISSEIVLASVHCFQDNIMRNAQLDIY